MFFIKFYRVCVDYYWTLFGVVFRYVINDKSSGLFLSFHLKAGRLVKSDVASATSNGVIASVTLHETVCISLSLFFLQDKKMKEE